MSRQGRHEGQGNEFEPQRTRRRQRGGTVDGRRWTQIKSRSISAFIRVYPRLIVLFFTLRPPRPLRFSYFFALLVSLAVHSSAQEPNVPNSHPPEAWPAARELDEARLSAAGISVLRDGPLTLVTDLPLSAEIKQLPRVIAAAVPLFAERFDVPPKRAAEWRVQAYLIKDLAKFASLGLLPEDREFSHGLALGREVWLFEQPSDYFRRHLLLHEATHSFMAMHLGGCGPGWYMEGMAELLGTHTWDSQTGKLELGIMPASRAAAPYWGRIKLLKESHQPLSLSAVLSLDNARPMNNEAYAWVWSLAHFLEHHPRYAEVFHKLPMRVTKPEFNTRMQKMYGDDWPNLAREWELFTRRIDYGDDIACEAIGFGPTEELGAQPITVKIDPRRGWQPTGVRVAEGDRLTIRGAGQFIIGREPTGEPWPCEANGVSLEYVGGSPLGELQVAIDDRDSPLDALGGLLQPVPIGQARTIVAPLPGPVFLRVNDSPAKRADNSGELVVTLSRAD